MYFADSHGSGFSTQKKLSNCEMVVLWEFSSCFEVIHRFRGGEDSFSSVLSRGKHIRRHRRSKERKWHELERKWQTHPTQNIFSFLFSAQFLTLNSMYKKLRTAVINVSKTFMITAPQSMFTFVNLTKVIFYCKSNLHIACLYLAGTATIAISLLTVVGEKLFSARAQIRPVWKTATGPRFVRQIFFFSSTSFSVLFFLTFSKFIRTLNWCRILRTGNTLWVKENSI